MHVRDATASDAEAVREVHAASIAAFGPAAYDCEQVEAWGSGVESADYAAIDAEEFEFVVAEADGDVVAFGSLLLAAPDGYRAAVDAELTAVYVHPEAGRSGVGSTVLAALEDRAREASVESLGLASSLNAVGFYERHGYERVRERAHEFSSGESTGVEGRVVEMATEL